jgi:ABC-type multidrug transport system permease subunit
MMGLESLLSEASKMLNTQQIQGVDILTDAFKSSLEKYQMNYWFAIGILYYIKVRFICLNWTICQFAFAVFKKHKINAR